MSKMLIRKDPTYQYMYCSVICLGKLRQWI
eukprot:SAG31_NODE_17850_length_655_cov_2.706835_2_plen_29_part_01